MILQTSDTMQTDKPQSEHRFGFSDWLDANDYEPGEIVEAKALAYLGRREDENADGDITNNAYYKVDSRGVQQEFKLGMKNERLLRKKHAVKGASELLGKTIVLKVKDYGANFGNGFVVVGLK